MMELKPRDAKNLGISLLIISLILISFGAYSYASKTGVLGMGPGVPRRGDTRVFAGALALTAGIDGSLKEKSYTYWHDPMSAWQNFDAWKNQHDGNPVEVSLGKTFWFSVGWLNTGSESLTGHVKMVIKKPDGTTVTPPAGTDSVNNQDKTAEPGKGYSVAFHWDLDVRGTYEAQIVLSDVKTGNVLDTWTGDVCVVPQEPGTAPTTHTLTTSVKPEGWGEVVVYRTGREFKENSRVGVSATPNDGYVFDHWEGDVANPNKRMTSVYMDSDKSITAVFRKPTPKYEVTTAIEPREAEEQNDVVLHEMDGTPLFPPVKVKEGKKVKASYVMSTLNWLFDHWEVNGQNYGSSEEIMFTVKKDTTVTAHFTENVIEWCRLTTETIPSSVGTVEPAKTTVKKGETITIRAEKGAGHPGYVFDHWSIDGQYYSSNNPTTVEMTTDKHVVAHWRKKGTEEVTLTVKVAPVSGGTVRKTGVSTKEVTKELTVEIGSTITLVANPSDGYDFKEWSGARNTTRNPVGVFMDSDKTITAVFEEEGIDILEWLSDHKGTVSMAVGIPMLILAISLLYTYYRKRRL